jgi:signal transduction histidine kinase
MESIQLSSFYRSLVHWPQTGMEVSGLLENFSKLLSAPFVALQLTDSAVKGAEKEPKLGFRFNDPELRFGTHPSSPRMSEVAELPLVVEEFIKKQLFQREPLKSVQSAGSSFRQVQVSGDFLNGFYLGLVPITAKTGEGTLNCGWLIAGFQKAFSTKEEILLIAAAQKLTELAELQYLESEIQLRSQFLSIASHELKTPLTSIYGMLQLQERMYRLKKDDPALKDPERQQMYLKRMIRQVERLNELIDGLLDISRIQNGRFMVEPTETDVAAVLREALASRFEAVAQEAGVKLHVEAPDSLIANVDPVRMEEVVSNLLMNAIRFSPEGGVVWVRLRSDQDSFRFTVRDQGPSVPIEDRERIFQPFERAQRTARLGGLGLGLFISRQIAQLHGGNVGLIESVPGKGNVFEANFPMRNVSAASA